MTSFSSYLSEQKQFELAVLELAVLAESTKDDSILDEAILDKAHGALTAIGLHAKQGKGLLHYALSAGKGIAKLFGAAVRGDTGKIKEIGKTVKKEEILDFLLKLDQATMHVVTGPLHTIDAVLGLHLAANLSAAAISATTAFKQAIATAKHQVHAAVANAKTKTKILNNIGRIEKLTTA